MVGLPPSSEPCTSWLQQRQPSTSNVLTGTVLAFFNYLFYMHATNLNKDVTRRNITYVLHTTKFTSHVTRDSDAQTMLHCFGPPCGYSMAYTTTSSCITRSTGPSLVRLSNDVFWAASPTCSAFFLALDFAWVKMWDLRLVDCANLLLHESNGQT